MTKLLWRIAGIYSCFVDLHCWFVLRQVHFNQRIAYIQGKFIRYIKRKEES